MSWSRFSPDIFGNSGGEEKVALDLMETDLPTYDGGGPGHSPVQGGGGSFWVQAVVEAPCAGFSLGPVHGPEV